MGHYACDMRPDWFAADAKPDKQSRKKPTRIENAEKLLRRTLKLLDKDLYGAEGITVEQNERLTASILLHFKRHSE